MKQIEYFKLQAKNLLKDYQTQFPVYDSVIDDYLNDYKPKYFDVGWIVLDFEIDDDKPFTLMNAQHIIAQLAGFYKWTDMLKSSEAQLELGKLLFDNSHKISVQEWKDYLAGAENDNNLTFSDETRLEIFTMVFANVDGHQSMMVNYRLPKNEKPFNESNVIKQQKKKKKTKVQISALPLVGPNLKKAIEVANWKFEDLLQMMEPRHPELIRKLWNPEKWINEVLKPDMLPIEWDYALSLIEAFLVHHFIELDTEADKQGINLN